MTPVETGGKGRAEVPQSLQDHPKPQKGNLPGLRLLEGEYIALKMQYSSNAQPASPPHHQGSSSILMCFSLVLVDVGDKVEKTVHFDALIRLA